MERLGSVEMGVPPPPPATGAELLFFLSKLDHATILDYSEVLICNVREMTVP